MLAGGKRGEGGDMGVGGAGGTNQFCAIRELPSGLRGFFRRLDWRMTGREERFLRFWRSRPILAVGWVGLALGGWRGGLVESAAMVLVGESQSEGPFE